MLPVNCHKTHCMFKLHTSCQHSLWCADASYALSDVQSPLQHGAHRALFKQCCASDSHRDPRAPREVGFQAGGSPNLLR